MSIFFGFENVSAEEKTTRVEDLFSRVASRYDVMNDVMSLGLHRLWKRHFVTSLPVQNGQRLLDMAGGTGDISFLIQKTYGALDVQSVVCDLTHGMLDVGQQRDEACTYASRLSWCCGDAQKLPFADETFDGYTISFGLRNVGERASALKEAYRVLRPGGWFACLEFSTLTNPALNTLYTRYSDYAIPLMGRLVGKDEAAYQYLVDSIRTFPVPEALSLEMQEAGFHASFTKLSGGVVCVHKGVKAA